LSPEGQTEYVAPSDLMLPLINPDHLSAALVSNGILRTKPIIQRKKRKRHSVFILLTGKGSVFMGRLIY